jgi:hypothetical protein
MPDEEKAQGKSGEESGQEMFVERLGEHLGDSGWTGSPTHCNPRCQKRAKLLLTLEGDSDECRVAAGSEAEGQAGGENRGCKA